GPRKLLRQYGVPSTQYRGKTGFLSALGTRYSVLVIYKRVSTSSAATGSRRPSSNSTNSRRARISWASTRPCPLAVTTRLPTGGSAAWNSSYTSCSNRRQHFNRPHRPEIFDGSSVDFWSFAIRMLTGGITTRWVLQQTGLPQSP